jgi:hypothetical protein
MNLRIPAAAIVIFAAACSAQRSVAYAEAAQCYARATVLIRLSEVGGESHVKRQATVIARNSLQRAHELGEAEGETEAWIHSDLLAAQNAEQRAGEERGQAQTAADLERSLEELTSGCS